MIKASFGKVVRLWLLVAILIMPQAGVAESPLGIAVDVVIHEGRFVIFYLTNFYEDKAFRCPFIRVRATVKDRQGNIVALRSITARNVALPAGSREKQEEVGKEIIQKLELQFDQPRIVDVSDPYHNCQSIQTTPPPPVTPPPLPNNFLAGKVFRDRLKDGSLGPEMVRIPAGSFRMGDIQGSGFSNEKPVHKVSVGAFAIGKYEVTFAEYDKFAQATGKSKPSDSGWGRGNRPVIRVFWDDATAYASWLSKQTGKKYRLPTEAEWEYAARAGTETKYWWGNRASHDYMNYGTEECCDGFAKGKDRWKYTAPVGSFGANPFGLHDVHGNVLEWVSDIYSRDYYSSSPRSNPKGPSTGRYRVLRGSSWDFTARLAGVATRGVGPDSLRYYSIGFRLLRQP